MVPLSSRDCIQRTCFRPRCAGRMRSVTGASGNFSGECENNETERDTRQPSVNPAKSGNKTSTSPGRSYLFVSWSLFAVSGFFVIFIPSSCLRYLRCHRCRRSYSCAFSRRKCKHVYDLYGTDLRRTLESILIVINSTKLSRGRC